MRRREVLAICPAFLLVGIALVFKPAIAQETTPVVPAEHPVVGAWWTANDAPGPGVSTATAVFHADGTYLEVDPNIGVGIGAWQATGERSADLVAVYQDINPDPVAAEPGTVTVRKSVTLDEAGETFTGSLTVEVRIPDGTVVFTASYAGQGTRLEVAAPLPFATPLAGTPVP